MLSREAVMARDLNGGIHISDSGSSSSDSQVSGGGGSCVSSKGKKKVEFDSDGQPVGDGSKEFSSLLGGTTKTHCPISYESFKNVPSPTKNIIWSSVVGNLLHCFWVNLCILSLAEGTGFASVIVGSFARNLVMAFYSGDGNPSSSEEQKWISVICNDKCKELIADSIQLFVAKSFREFKHRLRVKYYDKYDNDVDRKRNCPTGVKLEEWEKFVDNESKPLRKLMRTKGKVAREAVKALHTSGRRGAARTVHDMKSKNPNVKVTRTDSYMAIHTHKDGSFIAFKRMRDGLEREKEQDKEKRATYTPFFLIFSLLQSTSV
ncbi:hypothetical protein IFM89_000777 [Coptis chinensis]|uniref:Uncharacterized protein n=1 Tax=Coptis chinensis TaxID=261450 RepID=A0A835M875_9MAGN|nr:hypothetical protein IFM89_000777 [Coptis chinensis]